MRIQPIDSVPAPDELPSCEGRPNFETARTRQVRLTAASRATSETRVLVRRGRGPWLAEDQRMQIRGGGEAEITVDVMPGDLVALLGVPGLLPDDAYTAQSIGPGAVDDAPDSYY